MPSKTKSLKTKPLKKTPKALPSQLKPHSPSLKHPPSSTIFKNLELETACELPMIDEIKTEPKPQTSPKQPASIEMIPVEEPAIIMYEGGLLQVDLWQPCLSKGLWDSLIDF